MKLESEMKRKIMRNKWKLRGEEVWIEEDLTWEERRLRWKMRQFAIKKEKRGKKVRIGERGMWIEGVWWRWDEKREKMMDGRGRDWERIERRSENGGRVSGGFRE